MMFLMTLSMKLLKAQNMYVFVYIPIYYKAYIHK